MTYFFFPLREINLLNFIAIAKMARMSQNEAVRLVLLLPNHPRLNRKFGEGALKCFDEVHCLPYFSPSIHLVSILREMKNFVDLLSVIRPDNQNLLFVSNVHQLIHFVLIRSLRRRLEKYSFKVVDVLFGSVVTKNIQIDMRRTLFFSLFSLLFTSVFTRVYKSSVTQSVIDFAYYPKLSDIEICIEHQRSPCKRVLSLANAPFPLRGVRGDDMVMQTSTHLPRGAVLFFLSPEVVDLKICPDAKAYLLAVKEMLFQLVKCFERDKVFIKLHPNSSVQQEKMIANLSSISMLDKDVSAEEIFIRNRASIHCVYGAGSTALVTASWFEIPSYDCGSLLGYDRIWLSQVGEYLGYANRIVIVSSLEDIQATKDFDKSFDEELNMRKCREEWGFMFHQIHTVALR